MTDVRVDAYWESTAPGSGRRAARADAVSDARVLSLNGTWRFRLSPTADGTGSAFLHDDFDDSSWDPMTVPSHWVLEEFTPLAGGERRRMLGTEEGPLYTNTAYPIPLDPPRIPVENPTGDYRLVFDVPSDFGGAVLRFQGVDSCAKVWLNGEELGWSTGSRLPFEFDVVLRPGPNVLAVRVHRWSAGTYLEDQDMWWLPGIFRDVEIIERPTDAIDDHFVHADYDHVTGLGTLRVDATVSGVVDIPELGIAALPVGESVSIPVEPWSAESPRLYRGVLRSAGESIELAIGFRHVEVVDGVFTVNGRAVTFRGVNRHEHHPRTGRTLDRATMIRDIELMKRANIDAVRTSHYPPHPDFIRLCDEYGLWVVVEVDLETHGFIYEGWAHNPPALPEWHDAIMDRLMRTVERDKNSPSVVVWSLANESMTGSTFTDMRRWLDQRDPSRAVLYERDPRYRDSDFYSLMYPSLDLLERIGRREEPRGGRLSMHGMVFDADDDAPDGITDAEDERRRGLPFLLVEYAHAMGNGPGGLQDYWRIIRAHDRLCGAFVWEWIDHGFTDRLRDGTEVILHGDDIDYEPRGGRFGLHGLVFSDRTPTPALIELAKAHETVHIDVGAAEVRIVSERHSTSTADLELRWHAEVDGVITASGVLDAPVLLPGGECVVALPTAARVTGPDAVVTVEAVLAADTRWAPAGHVVSWGQFVGTGGNGGSAIRTAGDGTDSWAESADDRTVAPAPEADGGADLRRGTATRSDEHRVGPARFDPRTGQLRGLGDLTIAGPVLDLYRAPTENDRGQGDTNNIAAVWQRTMLDRLLHRVDEVDAEPDRLRVRGRTAPRAHPHGVEWEFVWSADGDAVLLQVSVDFVGPWTNTPYLNRDILVPRLGLLFELPAEQDRVTWFGRGPGETYVDSFAGSRIGRFTASVDDLQVAYPVPQENGNHVQTRWLEMAGSTGAVLCVEGAEPFDFTARRWTAHDLARADKQHQLRDSGSVWLNIDHAQQGLGSASVGPALPEQYRIPREHTTWSVRLATTQTPRQ
ncbi:glycoside hydrolase family 2 TIM barrel-domain containing protein [Microbacterium gorillae]|uniref:glycoside hydrolase family 2 TIM barrel-domain containing protein n=1 Tax=Microbacterium gorillae TaxID=1231063 RepID=UPI003D95A1C7